MYNIKKQYLDSEMIERFYLKDFLSFKKAGLDFHNGLIVFSGPSGSGKSILMDAVLASFGLASCDAAVCESSVTWEIDEEFGIESEEINVFKQIKREKTRYFINNQSVSKKSISKIAATHLRHLSLKDYSDFENDNLLDIIDKRVAKKENEILMLKKELKESFYALDTALHDLQRIEEEQQRIVELKEFAAFEIEKIASVNPKKGEYEELMQIKKELSKKEKVLESIEKANAIFEMEYAVTEALELLDEESAFFDDTMNELRSKLESASERFAALDEIDVEEVLDRLETLSELKRKYGSIDDALIYMEKKKEELAKYENIEFTKEELKTKVAFLRQRVQKLAEKLSQKRLMELDSLEKELNDYTQQLYLQKVSVSIQKGKMTPNGFDIVDIKLNETPLTKVSTGEFNRLRLAVLVLKSEFLEHNSGVLILDEIDANLSGEESMSVAKVLRKLAKKYQILVISHQPQLTSQGEQHFLVYKENGESKVKELQTNERVDEIARIISGEHITKEAVNFARELLKNNL